MEKAGRRQEANPSATLHLPQSHRPSSATILCKWHRQHPTVSSQLTPAFMLDSISAGGPASDTGARQAVFKAAIEVSMLSRTAAGLVILTLTHGLRHSLCVHDNR